MTTCIGVELRRDNLWALFDKYPIFAIEYKLQRKFVVYSLLACLANATVDSLDTVGYLSLTRPDEIHYWHVSLLFGFKELFGLSDILVKLARVTMQLMFIASEVFRFYRVTIITFAALCVASHLQTLQELLIESELEESRSSFDAADYRKFATNLTTDADDDRTLELSLSTKSSGHFVGNTFLERRDNIEMLSVSLVPQTFNYPKFNEAHRSFPRSSFVGESSHKLWPDDKNAVSTYVDDGASRDKIERPSDQSAPFLELKSLHELEWHLKDIDNFIIHLDYEEPILVCVMILLIIFLFVQTAITMTDVYLTGYYLEACWQLVWLAVRFLTLLSVFKSCDLVQLNARNLLLLFEQIYLQKCYTKQSSIRTMFKGVDSDHGPRMSSLKRIIETLNGIKFNCDTLLDINLGTLTRLLLYTVGFMFIVIQYGKLYRLVPISMLRHQV